MRNMILKIIYNPLINYFLRGFSKFSYNFFGKKLMSISGSLDLAVDRFKFKIYTNQTSSVTQELYYEGAINYEFTPLFIELIKSSKVFLDIGANIGYFSLLGSKINPSCEILAIEPSIGSLHYLIKNIDCNSINNVKVVNKAVSSSDERLIFYEVRNSKYKWLDYNLNGSNSLEGKYLNKDKIEYEVDTTSIASLVEDFNLKEISLIKLDTECTEHLILDSALDEINLFRPIIIAEVYPVIENEIEKIICKMDNYFVYQINNHKFLKEISTFQGISEKDLDRNFMFVPNNKIHLIENFIIT